MMEADVAVRGQKRNRLAHNAGIFKSGSSAGSGKSGYRISEKIMHKQQTKA
jgi:hypothetical protein